MYRSFLAYRHPAYMYFFSNMNTLLKCIEYSCKGYKVKADDQIYKQSWCQLLFEKALHRSSSVFIGPLEALPCPMAPLVLPWSPSNPPCFSCGTLNAHFSREALTSPMTNWKVFCPYSPLEATCLLPRWLIGSHTCYPGSLEEPNALYDLLEPAQHRLYSLEAPPYDPLDAHSSRIAH